MSFKCRRRRQMSVAWIVAMLCVCASAEKQSARAQDVDSLAATRAMEETFIAIIQRCEVSIVSIARIRVNQPSPTARRLNPFGLDFRQQMLNRDRSRPDHPNFIPTDFGTGIVIAPAENSEERFILTNYHVVKGGPSGDVAGQFDYRLYVRFADRRGTDARILAADPRSDLALLQIDFSRTDITPSDLKPIEFGDAANIRKGQMVVALGNPYAAGRDGSASASWGIVSNLSRRPPPLKPLLDRETRQAETLHHFGTLIQSDLRLNLGTSGGALVNLEGKLVGITTSLAALEGYEQSAGFAIPLDESTRRMIHALTRGHEVEYGFLGVTPVDLPAGQLSRLSGTFEQSSAAMARTVMLNSPADRAGLRANDIILAVNDRPVYDHLDLMREIGRLAPEEIARLKVWSEQNRTLASLDVKLGKWPVINEEDIIAPNPRYPYWRGVAVDYPTARFKFLDPFEEYHQAVLVTKVPPGLAAASNELKVGDLITRVNETPVKTPAEFHRAVEGLEGSVILRLNGDREVVIAK